MGNAFNGHCNGSNLVKPPNVLVAVGSETTSGTNIKKQNIPSESFAEQQNISKCAAYTPKSTTTQLPKMSNSVVAKNYYSNNFTVNNIIANNSCNLIPRGIIMAWYGKGVPEGWVLCDGTNCTPDLRGRAILGFDTVNNKIGQIGGEEQHLLTIGEIPAHSHSYNKNATPKSFLTGATGSGKSYNNGKSTVSSPNYTYLNDSKNLPHNNMPPFTVCSYIMKL
jgi:microcystin-dependent protein